MKLKIGLILSICLLTTSLFAQNNTTKEMGEPSFALYLNGPSGLISKLRIKAELRFDNNLSIMGAYSDYHMWAGNQSYIEMRRYKIKPFSTQKYLFARVGRGQTFQGEYVLAAFGWGTQRYFGKDKRFFIDYSKGFKLCPQTNTGLLETEMDGGLEGLFYILGPGAIFDLNLNIGYRF